MSFPIPSFFKMRLIIAVVLVFFGFFFIGMLHRVFACESVDGAIDPNWPVYDLQYYDSQSGASAACTATGYPLGSWDCTSPDCPGMPKDIHDLSKGYYTEYQGYYICWANRYSDHKRFVGLYCADVDPCADVSPSPVDACYSEFNINWTDQATCQYSGCKCPDYTGQENYDFETCSLDTDPDPCADQAVSECSTLEKVVWDNITTCSYHCDQGGCEDEYQTAKQECETPHLVDALACSYTCECEAQRNEADEACPHGYFIDDSTCQYTCKCCEDKATECLEQCGTADNISAYSCTDHTDSGSSCIIDTYTPCECIVSLPADTDPPPVDPEPDPDNSGDGHDPDPIDYIDKNETCLDYRNSCPSSCQFVCETDFDTGKVKYHNCDCNDDPSDPGPDGVPGTPDDGDPGSADDGSNGWLKQIESNTSGLSDGLGEANGWLKAIKHNTDEVLEDTDNISENVRRGLENDKKYFSDSQGVPYLKKINDKLGSLDKLEGNTGTVVGDSDYPLDESGYGEEPTDADLPANEELDSSFGTFTPSEPPSYIDVAESALNSLRPALSSGVCTFDIVFDYHSGLVDIDYSHTFNLCQYQAIFNMIGNVLIALASFFNLYKLAFG